MMLNWSLLAYHWLLKFFAVQLSAILEEERVVLQNLILDLGKTAVLHLWLNRSRLFHFHLVLVYVWNFQSFNQLLAYPDDIRRKMSPLNLWVIESFLCILLFPLVIHKRFLHLHKPFWHFTIHLLRRWSNISFQSLIGQEQARWGWSQMRQTQFKSSFMNKRLKFLF